MLYGVTRFVLILIKAYIISCAILKIFNVGKHSCGWEMDAVDSIRIGKCKAAAKDRQDWRMEVGPKRR
jgi:hypothetical protein